MEAIAAMTLQICVASLASPFPTDGSLSFSWTGSGPEVITNSSLSHLPWQANSRIGAAFLPGVSLPWPLLATHTAAAPVQPRMGLLVPVLASSSPAWLPTPISQGASIRGTTNYSPLDVSAPNTWFQRPPDPTQWRLSSSMSFNQKSLRKTTLTTSGVSERSADCLPSAGGWAYKEDALCCPAGNR